MNPRMLVLASTLAAFTALAATPAHATPSIFDGTVAPEVVSLGGATATYEGGQVLYRGFTFIPDFPGGIYASTSRIGGAYTNPLTVTFSEPVTSVSLFVLNFGVGGGHITVNGGTPNFVGAGGVRSISASGAMTSITVARTDDTGQLLPEWDFAIVRVSCSLGTIELAATAPPGPDGFVFTQIADPTTAIPGDTGNFFTFGSLALSGDTVAFEGRGTITPVAQEGIYTGSGGEATLVADRSTPPPGGSGTIASYEFASISGTSVSFASVAGASAGIYASFDGMLTVIADTTTDVPEGAGTFTGFPNSGGTIAAVSGTSVVFRGTSDSGPGIYLFSNGSLSRIADTSTPVPDGPGNFTGFGGVAISGATVAFAGSRVDAGVSHRGIYAGTAGALVKIVDVDTPVPGDPGDFDSLSSSLSLSGSTVAFVGGNDDRRGVYTGSGGALTTIADTETPFPDGMFNFSSFSSTPSISGTTVAFDGDAIWGQTGLFLSEGGVLRKVIGANPIGARTAVALSLSSFGLDGTSLAFSVLFDTMQPAIFRADWEGPECGDGSQDAGEECDDGNTDDGDGCSAGCVVEFCGDGIVQGGGMQNSVPRIVQPVEEECDDGNNHDGDGCSADCRVEDFCTQMCARPEAKHVSQKNGMLIGTPGDDILCGDHRNNTLRGNRGDDVLCGFGGNDSLQGHQGDDRLEGGDGKDTLRGDSGDDTLNGGDGDDTLYGHAGDDVIDGGAGDDKAFGYGGDDVIRGGEGNDVLRGGPGNDTLDGGEGTDRLIGESGTDACESGEVVSQCEDDVCRAGGSGCP